ncbi:hypothetical protein NC651_015416 [Populus alba x Populus x berolinensis]|nr:hypothetical protein NC651_015416 [Populus alba x Populus x berolinensis]
MDGSHVNTLWRVTNTCEGALGVRSVLLTHWPGSGGKGGSGCLLVEGVEDLGLRRERASLSPAVMGVCCGMIGGVVEKCWPIGLNHSFEIGLACGN